MDRPNMPIGDFSLKSESSAVAAAIKIDNLHLFSAPVKFLNSNPQSIRFHSIGGRCRRRESLLTALQRECLEEIGRDLQVLSSRSTSLITSEGYRHPLTVSECPRPFCILKKTTETDPSFCHREIYSLVAYRGKISHGDLSPRRELAFLLFLTDDMLAKCHAGRITYEDILRSTDGSKLVSRPKLDFDHTKTALPAGLALVLAREISKSAAAGTT